MLGKNSHHVVCSADVNPLTTSKTTKDGTSNCQATA